MLTISVVSRALRKTITLALSNYYFFFFLAHRAAAFVLQLLILDSGYYPASTAYFVSTYIPKWLS